MRVLSLSLDCIQPTDTSTFKVTTWRPEFEKIYFPKDLNNVTTNLVLNACMLLNIEALEIL